MDEPAPSQPAQPPSPSPGAPPTSPAAHREAPPTYRGTATPAPRQAVWPTVLGVIILVLSILGLLMHAWTVVSTFLLDSFAFMGDPDASPFVRVMHEWAPFNAAMSAIAGGLAVLAIVGAVGLLVRSSWARSVLLAWAVLRAAHVVVVAAGAYLMQAAQFEAMAQDPQFAGAPAFMGSGFALFSAAGSLLWGWALPAFVLIWFLRSSSAAEMAGWRAARNTAGRA